MGLDPREVASSVVDSFFMLADFRKNANVLTALHALATPKQKTPTHPYVVDGYELHAHPDLVDRLRDLMAYASAAQLEFAYGIPVLCTPEGRIFATAGGTNSLKLYLPERETWGREYAEYGNPWREGRAWTTGRVHTPEDEEQLAALLRLAYSTAANMDTTSS
jgi:hypothetical protein